MATTVRDIRAKFLSLFPDFLDMKCSNNEECLILIKLVSFWEKLNRLGARNMDTILPETVPDIDATVVLTDEECARLHAEMTYLRVDMIELKQPSQKFYA